MLQCSSGEPLPTLSVKEGEFSPAPRDFEEGHWTGNMNFGGEMESTLRNLQGRNLDKNFFSNLTLFSLFDLSCRYSPLVKPKWKPEGKGALDTVHTGQPPGQRADGGERRVDLGRQKVLSTHTLALKFVNQ